ncbi:hypothetical protein QN277_007401 [Acacia crassicarpa]|uniref:Uncharacterized protein n=1 Tax=Acacia crassicarpa TaxID=499986 RepID=A0AAE1IV38_9FABA|nr:hypothetical protein QN277_007401 [Acacia crassicarpa]
MDGAAGYLGIKAEIEQNKVKHLRLWIFECREPSLEAFLLGLGAVALSAIAHVIANLLGGCNCIFSQQEFAKAPPNTQLSVACLILTWDQDCDGCWNVHADDMGFVKQKFKGFVWEYIWSPLSRLLLAPPATNVIEVEGRRPPAPMVVKARAAGDQGGMVESSVAPAVYPSPSFAALPCVLFF